MKLREVHFHKAAINGDWEQLKALIEEGVPVDCRPHFSSHLQFKEHAKPNLQQEEEEEEWRGGEGWTWQQLTALRICVALGNPKCVSVLLDAGASIDEPFFLGNDNKKSTSVSFERSALLDGHGPPLPLLHECALAGRPRCLAILLRYGAHVDIRDCFGRSALHWASIGGKGSDPIQELLPIVDQSLEGSLDIDGEEEEEHNAVKCVQLLLRFGALVDAQTGRGLTPLHLAASSGQYAIAKLLGKHSFQLIVLLVSSVYLLYS